MYQSRYLHGSRSRSSTKSAIYTAAGCQHKIAIYTAAVPEPIQIYTRLSCVLIKSLFTGQPFKSQIGYIHCCRMYTKNRYLHGSRSRAKSAIYIAAGCIQKIVIYTAAVQEPIRLYTLLRGVYIKLSFTRQPFKSQIETAALSALNAIKQRVFNG